jgi:hypothetical protein
MILHDGPAVLGFEPWREIDAPHFGGKFPRATATAMDTGLIARQAVEPLTRLLLGAVTLAAGRWLAAATSARSAPITRAHCARALDGLRTR